MSAWLIEALATGSVEKVRPNMGAAGERINDARRDVRSARLLADDDTTLAIAACHDAIRKALTGHMTAKGLRVRGAGGAHKRTLDYARSELGGLLSEDDLEEADELRKDRALAEYGDFASRQLTPSHVLAAAEVAERIVAAVANDLAGPRP